MEGIRMKTQYLPWYALAVAVAFVGALAFGVPVSTLLLLGVVLACPLMMMFMMGGHSMGGGHDDGHDADDTRHHHDYTERS
jgi:hypothetical protein